MTEPEIEASSLKRTTSDGFEFWKQFPDVVKELDSASSVIGFIIWLGIFLGFRVDLSEALVLAALCGTVTGTGYDDVEVRLRRRKQHKALRSWAQRTYLDVLSLPPGVSRPLQTAIVSLWQQFDAGLVQRQEFRSEMRKIERRATLEQQRYEAALNRDDIPPLILSRIEQQRNNADRNNPDIRLLWSKGREPVILPSRIPKSLPPGSKG